MLANLHAKASEVTSPQLADVGRLIAKYERTVVACARARIEQYKLQHELDPEDLANMVFTSILERPDRILRLGPLQLWSYLDRATEYKAHDEFRRQHRRKCDARRRVAFNDEVVPRSASPVRQDSELEFNETLAEAYELLTADERTCAMWRRAGYEWSLIANWIGRSEAAVRKQFERAMNRVRDRIS